MVAIFVILLTVGCGLVYMIDSQIREQTVKCKELGGIYLLEFRACVREIINLK